MRHIRTDNPWLMLLELGDRCVLYVHSISISISSSFGIESGDQAVGILYTSPNFRELYRRFSETSIASRTL